MTLPQRSPEPAPSNFAPQRVRVEERSGGEIRLSALDALGPTVRNTGEWLHRWAAETPDALFLAARDGQGWRRLSYEETLERVRAIAASLLTRDLGLERPVLVLSGNGIEHALLALAAQYAGIPLVPAAEQYALIPGAHNRLRLVAEKVTPGLVFAADSARFAEALALPVFDGVEKVTLDGAGGSTAFAALEAGRADAALDAAHATVGPDTVAKILFTSGSTSAPKGVITTHGMMCTNQAQIAQAWPFLTRRPPRIVDWLPWNHVFGGSHNFNMMLANGGSLYIDEGRPTPKGFEATVRNIKEVVPTICFNVPIGFSMLTERMETDADLRQAFFAESDLIFYAGAGLPIDVWKALEKAALAVRGGRVAMGSSWGMTESAPASLMVHETVERSGIIGVPLPGLEVRLLPVGDGRYELRAKGPNVTPGYHRDADKTAAAFDEDGFLITGDAVRFLDPADPDRGMSFDGRISEDFKLTTGTWVQATRLRLQLVEALAGLAADIVIAGADRAEIGLLVFPTPALAATDGTREDRGALVGEALAARLTERLGPLAAAATGSSTRVTRVLVLAEPAALGEGEMTDKGNLNPRRVLDRRASLVERLYDDADPATIHITEIQP